MSTVTINVRDKSYYAGTRTLDGNAYLMRFYWNINTSKWYMNIKGLSNSVEINGIALIAGKDLLSNFGYYELGQLRVIDNSGSNEDPDYTEFGSRWTLEYTER